MYVGALHLNILSLSVSLSLTPTHTHTQSTTHTPSAFLSLFNSNSDAVCALIRMQMKRHHACPYVNRKSAEQTRTSPTPDRVVCMRAHSQITRRRPTTTIVVNGDAVAIMKPKKGNSYPSTGSNERIRWRLQQNDPMSKCLSSRKCMCMCIRFVHSAPKFNYSSYFFVIRTLTSR